MDYSIRILLFCLLISCTKNDNYSNNSIELTETHLLNSLKSRLFENSDSWFHYYPIDRLNLPDSVFSIQHKYPVGVSKEIFVSKGKMFGIQRIGCYETNKYNSDGYYHVSHLDKHEALYVRSRCLDSKWYCWYIRWVNKFHPDYAGFVYFYKENNIRKILKIPENITKTDIGIWTDTVYTNLPQIYIKQHFPYFKGTTIHKKYKTIEEECNLKENYHEMENILYLKFIE